MNVKKLNFNKLMFFLEDMAVKMLIDDFKFFSK